VELQQEALLDASFALQAELPEDENEGIELMVQALASLIDRIKEHA
jgi:hypothetical protein